MDLSCARGIEARVHEVGAENTHAELARSDPRSAARIHANDTKRLVRALEVLEQTGRPLSEWQAQWGWHGKEPPARRPGPAIVGLDGPAAEIDRRIEGRTRAMIGAGWPGEAAAIRAGEGFGPTAVQALGYAEALRLHDGEIDPQSCAAEIARKTKRFARRQRTWYRKIEGARWLRPAAEDGSDLGELAGTAIRALEELR